MNTTFRSLTFALAAVLGTLAYAQPVPPYMVTVTVVAPGCNGTINANIQSLPGTLPEVNIDLPLTEGLGCQNAANLLMESYSGGFVVTAPCAGMVVTDTIQYTINNNPLDSAHVIVWLDCGSGGDQPDCLGIPDGPNVPGSPCNDNDPATQNDTWTPDCDCAGEPLESCAAGLAISSTAPWTFMAFSQSTGIAPMTYEWQLPDGSNSTLENPSFTFTAPGTYGLCLTITAGNGCTSTTCDTLYVNDLGWIDFTNTYYDCLQIQNGPNLPGAPCTIPGTTLEGTWSMTCQCDTNTVLPFDCLGLINGPNLPGTPCTEPATGLTGSWTGDCTCAVDTSSTSCQANFWVLQAYTTSNEGDTTTIVPIPNEIWVWNLTSGGVAPYMYLWNFGDGTPASLDPYPTHVYASGGSYLLCLTIADASGCTSIHCDTITVDENGMYNGMIIGGRPGMLRNSFTLNVIAELPTAVVERNAVDEVALWPNPVEDVIGLSFHSMRSGSLQLMVVDANGRVVATSNQLVNNGANRHVLDVSDLESGLYLLQISDGTHQSSRRFVKN